MVAPVASASTTEEESETVLANEKREFAAATELVTAEVAVHEEKAPPYHAASEGLGRAWLGHDWPLVVAVVAVAAVVVAAAVKMMAAVAGFAFDPGMEPEA